MEKSDLERLNGDMARLADGDRSASRPVFEVLWPALVAFSERALGPGPDAADAAQEALKRIFEQVSAFDPERSALGWALAISGWECRTVLARRRRRRESPLEVEAIDAAARVEGPESEEALLSRALADAIATLSEGDQRTLREVFFESIDAQPSTLRKRKERAIGRLRAAWRRLYGT